MKLRKKIIWSLGGVFLAGLIGILCYLLSGSTAVESWVGSQLLEIGATYLAPEMRFEHLTYVRPRTVVLENLTLSSPDPAKPGNSVTILSVKRARLELTEIPHRGQPIRFSKVTLESPQFHGIAVTPGGAALVGFSHMLKDSAESRDSPSSGDRSSPPAAAPGNPPPMKLSDFLLIRKVEIANGSISYDSRTPGEAPIWLDGINAHLDFTPDNAASSAGLYAIATTISREPAFVLDVRGKVNFDTFALELQKLQLTLDLQEKNIHVLPPDMQKLLESAEVTGQLRVNASGTLPLDNWRKAALQSQGSLTAGRFAWGQSRLSVDSWNWDLGLQGGVATIRKSDVHLLGGELQLTGTIPLDGQLPSNLSLNASRLQIEKMLRFSEPGKLPAYAGNVAAEVTFSAPLAKWDQQAAGRGKFTIRQGRIDNLPLFGPIVTSVNNAMGKSLLGNRTGLTDTADGNFTFAGNGVRLDHLQATSGALALRGEGQITFDRRIDLRLNAGPLEHLQNSLGPVGEIWGSLSDSMAGYHVSGTTSMPQVSFEIGGDR